MSKSITQINEEIEKFNRIDRLGQHTLPTDLNKHPNWYEWKDMKDELSLLQSQLFAKQEIVEEINKIKEVGCVGMNEDFIKGSNWCNKLWLKKLEELKSKIEGDGK